MRLVAPDVLAEAVGLSPVFWILGLVTGFLLWLYGWRGHRFWVVLLATVLAGIYGMLRAPEYGSQPLLAGVFLAISSGMLALALARLAAFLFGGVAVCLLMQSLAPAWNDPFLWFQVGGFLGLVLFRTWTMALTSLGGTLLMVFSVLGMLGRWAKFPAVPWSEKHHVMLNWICGSLAALGLIGQFVMERRRVLQQKAGGSKEAKPPAPPPAPPAPPPARNKLIAWVGKIYRKAG